jgi:site-specific DNA-methyltransferase (adenine-specific)
MLQLSKTVVIWGGNYFTDYLPPSSQWLVWDKGQRDFSLADCELAWCSQPKAARVLTYARAAALQENGLHPTQKPIEVMRWCIRLTTCPGDTILDPFMGSGTTGVACRMEGRKFIGVEIDPHYYAIAEKRIANAQPPLLLLDASAVPAPEQAAMFAD